MWAVQWCITQSNGVTGLELSPVAAIHIRWSRLLLHVRGLVSQIYDESPSVSLFMVSLINEIRLQIKTAQYAILACVKSQVSVSLADWQLKLFLCRRACLHFSSTRPPPNPATSRTAPYLSTITLTLHFWLFLFVCEFCLNSCVASQFPWQQRWNCWTCTVKANTVMGLLKAQSGEEELWSGCSCCIGCLLEWGGAEGKRERERQSVEEALVERYEMPVSCVCR